MYREKHRRPLTPPSPSPSPHPHPHPHPHPLTLTLTLTLTSPSPHLTHPRSNLTLTLTRRQLHRFEGREEKAARKAEVKKRQAEARTHKTPKHVKKAKKSGGKKK